MILGLSLIVCGFIATYNYLQSKYPALNEISGFIEKATDTIAWITVFVGIWKFFGPDHYMRESLPTPFIGDLIPSFLAVCTGLLTNNNILNTINLSEDKKKRIISTLEKFRIPAGFSAIGAGIVHIISGGAPLL